MNKAIISIEAEIFWRKVIAAEIRAYSNVAQQATKTSEAGETLSTILHTIANIIAVPSVKP